MGELEGTYRVLQTPGARLGSATPAGVSTLEPGQGPPAGVARPAARTHLRVQLLDDSVELFDVEPKCDGQVLLTQVWQRLNLIECDYFGLEFQNVQSCWIWLEPMKPIIRQVQRPKSAVLRLAVKFFPPDPGQLQEEYTRYLFALQLKRDLLEERLTCTDTTAALLASHLLQAEVGDYDEVLDREHLRTHEYVPRQERALHRILAFHRELAGQTPAESDFQVLEIARKLDMYGIRFHSASDREGAKIKLAVSHTGVLVFQSSTRINTFNWSRLRKLSFKRKRFLLKLHPEAHGPYQDTLEFVLGSRDECKSFWKICVEHHTFFRLSDQPKPKAKAVLFSRGSSFRYSGRTQKQLADYVKGSGMKRAPYERRHSKAQMSLRALKVDLPRQSISFSEGVKTPVTPLPTTASFCSAPASPPVPPGPRDFQVGGSSSETGPQAPGVRRPAAERSSVAMAQLPRLPALQPHQGVGFGWGAKSCGPHSPEGLSCPTSGPDSGGMGRGRPAAGHGDRGEGPLAGGSSSGGGPLCGPRGHGGGPAFTLTSAQLQVSEEFIDDDPADISFFAGGSEAFSFPYGGLSPGCGPSSPEGSSPEGVPGDGGCGFEFEEGSLGDAHPLDTSELLEVKAQASLMQRLLSPSDTSSLRNNQSEASSLSNAPLPGGLSAHTPGSAPPSGASSMANFPACSVRSEASSAFQFSDIVDQSEQLSYPPTAAEDSSSSDTDSWGSEAAVPLDVSLFFSSPFVQARADRVIFDLQNNMKNLIPGEPMGLSVESPQPSPSTQRSPPGLSPQGPATQGPSPLLGPVLADAAGARTDDREKPRRKCMPTDEAYFIAKEILATERTYLKDLEVITVWFRNAVVKADAMPADLMTLLFSNIDPIYGFHRGFLREVEQRLVLWEESSSTQATGNHQRIGDILLRNMLQLKALTGHFQRLQEILTELEAASRRLRRLEALRRDFELQKVCYLPLNAFLLKPLQRLRHYRLLLRRLCAPVPGDPDPHGQDHTDLRDALQAITEVTSELQHSLLQLESLQKLTELQRHLVGIESLVAPGRELVREGCLLKLTKKGLQQRMFFLFSDMLLYASRDAAGSSHFWVRGLLPLRGMLLIALDPPVEDRESEQSVPHCFTIYAAQKTIVVAASTQLEKAKWLHDLNAAIDVVKTGSALAPLAHVLCPLPRGFPDEASLEPQSEDEAGGAWGSVAGTGQLRASTTAHVCWCRQTSVSRADHSAASENQLSGYLLRKFKNSSGWQKLWVVFTNFCLFFYKTHQDDHPLASLPLLGYSVSLPRDTDSIHKEHVFKLQFKSHVYFFRAESKYTFRRWMEVIERASASAGRAGTPEEEA